MDWFVLLTPLVVLGVLLLLGFAGCHKVFGLDPVGPVHTLTLEVRVPSDLQVRQNRFQWTRPGSTVVESTNVLDRRDEANSFVLSCVVDGAIGGDWKVACRLLVEEAAVQADDITPYDFTLMDDTDGTFLFETVGRPSTNDFEVVPVGLQ